MIDPPALLPPLSGRSPRWDASLTGLFGQAREALASLNLAEGYLGCTWVVIVEDGGAGLGRVIPISLRPAAKGASAALSLEPDGTDHPFHGIRSEVDRFLHDDLGLTGMFVLHSLPAPQIAMRQRSWQLPLYYAARGLVLGLIPRLDIALTGAVENQRPVPVEFIADKAKAVGRMGLRVLLCPNHEGQGATVRIEDLNDLNREGQDATVCINGLKDLKDLDSYYADYFGEDDPLNERLRSRAQRTSDWEACLALAFSAEDTGDRDGLGKMPAPSLGLPGPRIKVLAAQHENLCYQGTPLPWEAVIDDICGRIVKRPDDRGSLLIALTPELRGIREAVYFTLRQIKPEVEILLDLDSKKLREEPSDQVIRLRWGTVGKEGSFREEGPGPFFCIGDDNTRPAGFDEPIALAPIREGGCKDTMLSVSSPISDEEDARDLYPIDLALIHSKLTGLKVWLPSSLHGALFRRTLVLPDADLGGEDRDRKWKDWRLAAKTGLQDQLAKGRFTGRSWLFEEVDRWLEKDKHPVFLMTAEPGWGKSRFAAELVDRHARVVAHHFFSEGDKDPFELAQLLIAQMADRIPEIRGGLGGLFDTGGREKEAGGRTTLDDAKRLFSTAVIHRLESDNSQPPRLIVLDRLDVAGRDVRLFLRELTQTPRCNVRILITSRSDDNLSQTIFPSSVALAEHFTCDMGKNKEDVTEFLASELSNLATELSSEELRRRLGGLVPEEATGKIMERAGGLFIYIHFVLESLKVATPESPLNISALPDGLFGLYYKWFDHLEGKKLPGGDRSTFRDDHDLLGLLCVLREDPSLDLLLAFLETLQRRSAMPRDKWNRARLQQALQKYQSFFPRKPDGTYRAYHPTVSEWLLDRKRERTFAIDEERIHDLIITACTPPNGWGEAWLEYMNAEP